jgi:hypothetical protein
MADAFNLSQMGNLPPELYEQQQNLNRQQQMAQLLMQQGQQAPQGQMISGRYVAPSFTQNLASLAQTGVGAYLQNKGDKQALDIAKQLREGKLGTQQALMEALNAGDTKKALGIATADQYGAGKEFIPQLVKASIPETPSSVREFEYAQKNPQYAEYQVGLKRAGGTNLNVNTGQHGFDNALKLRSDFRAEPIYKGFEETKAAKLQIDQAAKMATPAGDLAAATKIMKILDPGSVVRESELGMAMAATGVEDRVRNYAQMVIDGTKLTSNQRKDFTDLSNRLYNASAEQFNQKRDEYAGIAQRNKLDVDAAVGGPAPIKSTPLNLQDQQALQWANANPKDPRAAQIKQKLGQK